MDSILGVPCFLWGTEDKRTVANVLAASLLKLDVHTRNLLTKELYDIGTHPGQTKSIRKICEYIIHQSAEYERKIYKICPQCDGKGWYKQPYQSMSFCFCDKGKEMKENCHRRKRR